MNRCRPCLLVMIVFLGTMSHAAPAPLSLAPEHWSGDPLVWKMRPNALVAAGDRTVLMVHRKFPVSGRASVAADVAVHESVGSEWKVAAVALVQDAGNFWHVALVETPDTAGGEHRFELAEMRDGKWLAHHNLRVESWKGPEKPWRTGESYRLTLAISPSGIEGQVQDTKGEVLISSRIVFSAPAVTTGRPALRCGGFRATYTNIQGETGEPVKVPEGTKTTVPYLSKSFAADVHGKKTGFFRVEKQGDLWWVIDPLGRGFIPLGVDHVRYSGHWCSALGNHPHEIKNDARYSSREAWAEETLSRLTGWGFNLLTAGNDERLRHRGMAHTFPLNIGSKVTVSGDEYYITPHEKRPCTAFPNVFHPDFARFCRYEAERQCRQHADDPWLFGYFLDNELAWWGRSWGDHSLETGLFDAVMKLDASHTAKRALRDFVRKSFDDDIEIFNSIFGVSLRSFDDVLGLSGLDGTVADIGAVVKCKGRFARLIAEKYFGTITDAIRAADPNHMILGCRFAGGRASPQVWEVAGKYCDICTFNYYGNVDLDRGIALGSEGGKMGPPLPDAFAAFHNMGKRPMMVTEWSFPALDAGLPSTKGAGQRFRTQTERARASGIFAETVLRMPFMVGYDYFMWVDEPALGITPEFPENSNYGLIDEDGRPYDKLVSTFSNLHQRAATLRRQGLNGLPKPAPGRDYAKGIAAWLSSVKKTASGRHPNLHATSSGKTHTVRTKRFEVKATLDGDMLTDQVRFDGVLLGRFNGMLHVHDKRRDTWNGVTRLTAVETAVNGNSLAMLLTGKGHSGSPFELTYRLTFFPEEPWFLAEFVSARNTGELPLDIRDIYFRLHSQIMGNSENDQPCAQYRAPRLWGRLPGDAWMDPRIRMFWGAAAPRGSDVQIHFWLNEHGGQHPDARREIEHTLEPGEEYCPDQPTFVVIAAGKGGEGEWDRQIRTILAP